MQIQNKPTWEVQQSQEGIIAEAEYEKEIKHYPRPEYCKCNAGHTLVEVFNEKRNCYDWDCPICIAKKMQKAGETSCCIECGNELEQCIDCGEDYCVHCNGLHGCKEFEHVDNMHGEVN